MGKVQGTAVAEVIKVLEASKELGILGRRRSKAVPSALKPKGELELPGQGGIKPYIDDLRRGRPKETPLSKALAESDHPAARFAQDLAEGKIVR